MNNRDFLLVNYDTDSITICNKDLSPFSDLEKDTLIEELNSLFDENIKWEDDGYYETIVVIAAKNYILKENGKIKIKGSSLKAPTKSPALKEFIDTVIGIMVNIENKEDMLIELQSNYIKYVKEVSSITDIKRWASRKTLSSTMVASTRLNETKVMDALKGSDYTEGSRFYTYFKEDDTLGLVENFNGIYNKTRLYKALHDTISVFDSILDVKKCFLNYALVRNQKLLDNL